MLLEQKPMVFGEMVTYLEETYSLQNEVAVRDASAFVTAMLERGFLV